MFIHLHFKCTGKKKRRGYYKFCFCSCCFLLFWVDRIPSFVLHIRFRLCTSRCTYLARVPKTCQQQRKDSLNNFIRSRFFFFSFFFFLLNLNANSWIWGRHRRQSTGRCSYPPTDSRRLISIPVTRFEPLSNNPHPVRDDVADEI